MKIGPDIGPDIGISVGPPSDPTATTLTVTLADSADPVAPDAAYDYTVVVENTGAATALDVVAAVTLAAGIGFVSASGTGWTCAAVGQVVTCRRATLAVGVAPTITVSVTAPADVGEISTSVVATSAHNADAPTVITDTEATTVASGPVFPATADAFTARGLTPPNLGLWLMQEASGDLVDVLGVGNLVAAGTAVSYQAAINGTTRLGVVLDDATSRFTVAIPSGATSCTVALWFALTATPAGTRTLVQVNDLIYADVSVTPRIQANGSSLVTGTVDPGTGLHLLVIRVDATAPESESVATEDELLAPAYVLYGGTTLAIGSTGGASAKMGVCWAAAWTGASAEFTDAQTRTLYEKLGRPALW